MLDKKKFFLIVIVLVIPFLLIIQVWQVNRYNQLKDEVRALEKKQEEWIEKNKQVLTEIAALRSPERLEKLAREDMGLIFADYWDFLNIPNVEGEM